MRTLIIELAEIQHLIDNNLTESNRGNISDGYHTFNELYKHRCTLWMSLVNVLAHSNGRPLQILKSKKHHDGTFFNGYFVSCIILPDNKQISYHLPNKYWDEIAGESYEFCPNEFDGHTPDDVLDRLTSYFTK